MKKVTIYTDGACSGNPGPGGYGAILIYNDIKKELSGSEELTTNNKMELQAAIEALSALKEPCEVDLFTDSAYLCKAFNDGWIYSWIKKNWITSTGKPVENQEQWNLLLALSRKHKILWHKVKGHSNNEYNNLCDKLAREAIKRC